MAASHYSTADCQIFIKGCLSSDQMEDKVRDRLAHFGEINKIVVSHEYTSPQTNLKLSNCWCRLVK